MSKSSIESMMNENDVIEIDENSAPPSNLSGDKKDAATKKKKIAILLGIIVVAMAVSVVLIKPSAPPVLPERPAQEVVSQFASAVPNQDVAAGQVVSQAAPVADSMTAPATVPAAAPSPVETSTASVGCADSAVTKPDTSQEDIERKLAALEEENRRLKQDLQRAQQAMSATRRFYGSDVYRIYDDGVVLISPSGDKVPVAIGESMKRYGVLKKTNPADNSFVTDRGEFRSAHTN